MTLKELLEVPGDALSRYVYTLVRTLANPRPAFRPIAVSTEEQGISPLIFEPSQGSRLNPGVFRFAVTSVVLGTLLKSIGGSIPDTVGMATATVVVLTFWLLLSGAAHVTARLIGGTASPVESVTVTIQVFGAVYVLANFFGLLFFLIAGTWAVGAVTPDGLSAPFTTFLGAARWYFLFQGILLAIYLPFAIRNTHRLGWVRTALVFGIVALCATLLNLFLYQSSAGRIVFRK